MNRSLSRFGFLLPGGTPNEKLWNHIFKGFAERPTCAMQVLFLDVLNKDMTAKDAAEKMMPEFRMMGLREARDKITRAIDNLRGVVTWFQ